MTQRRPTSRRLSPPAMTLIELLMGLCILALIGAALAALLTLSAENWNYSQSRHNIRAASLGGANQVAAMLRSAKLIGVAYSDGNLANPAATALTTGSTCVSDATVRPATAGAACLFWMNTPSAIILAKDVALLEHDIAAQQLALWQIPATAGNANVQLHPADLDSAADVAAFKTLPNVVRRVVARNIAVCRINSYVVNNSATPRLMEMVLKIRDTDGERNEYWSIAPRAARATLSGL